LTGCAILPDGSFRFSFTNTPKVLLYVLATPFPTLPVTDWMVLGGVTEISAGKFQFTDPHATNYTRRFYRLRQPCPDP
jgi:hypothetical protein